MKAAIPLLYLFFFMAVFSGITGITQLEIATGTEPVVVRDSFVWSRVFWAIHGVAGILFLELIKDKNKKGKRIVANVCVTSIEMDFIVSAIYLTIKNEKIDLFLIVPFLAVLMIHILLGMKDFYITKLEEISASYDRNRNANKAGERNSL